MRSSATGGLAIGALSFWSLLPIAFASDPSAPLADFLLEDQAGARVHLYDPRSDWKATLLACLRLDDAASVKQVAELKKLHHQHGKQVRVLGIDPMPSDTRVALQEFCKKQGLAFPVLQDPLQVVTQRLEWKSGLEVLLLDSEYRLVHRGALSSASKALNALLQGKPIAESQSAAPKNPIPTSVAGTPFEELTFHREIKPILYRHCTECHRPNQIGPMELITYGDAVDWAPMIAEVVTEGRMPPWHANPRFGEFTNARALTETEKEMLVQWADRGAPEGNASEGPALPTFDEEGWSIGKPDLIVELPKEEQIPAEGVVPYRYVFIDPLLKEDVWVDAVEIRPTNRAVTHHVLVLLLPPEISSKQVQMDFDFLTGAGHLGVNIPGGRPAIYPEGYGVHLKAGTRFLFQLHYTPNGMFDTDRSRMGLRFAKGPVKHAVKSRAIVQLDLNIAPGDPAAKFDAVYEAPEDMRLLAVFPHMHSRGKSFRVDLDAQGQKKTVLDVPAYDFNWQHTYYLTEPQALKSGEKIYLSASYDNSAGNPRNPDPKARVRWGDQTWEEMLVGYITYVSDLESDAK